MENERIFLGKIVFSGAIECLTGLHIGASKDNMEIGAIDSPVIRDPVTREPYIAGSSLKGKLRSLLEKALSATDSTIGTNKRNIGTRNNPIHIHVCGDYADAVGCKLCRIFGSSGDKGGGNFPARLIVRDAYLTQESVERLSEIDTGLQYTEWKFENAIDRVTSAANPRQLERVPRGAQFSFELLYSVEDVAQLDEDIDNVRLAMTLLEADALGGHGSRGYGQVKLHLSSIEGKTVECYKGSVTPSTCRKIDSFESLGELKGFFGS